MSIASQYIRGKKAVAEAWTLSGISIITTETAVPSPEIKESVTVERNVAAATATITESVEVTVT